MFLELRQHYSVTDISRALQVSRSIIYYKPKVKAGHVELLEEVRLIFEDSEKTYGTRRIKFDLQKLGIQASRRKISLLMKELKISSVYTKPSKKYVKTSSSDENLPDFVGRDFNNRLPNEVLATDTTYIWLSGKWLYLCPILDLADRSVRGISVSITRDATLLQKAIHSIDGDLREIGILHNDRGSENRNALIKNLLSGFSIKQSFSRKGNPYDNAVVESFFKTLKTEFVNRHKFANLEDFVDKLDKFVNRYNTKRSHSSLGYMTPFEWREHVLQKEK